MSQATERQVSPPTDGHKLLSEKISRRVGIVATVVCAVLALYSIGEAEQIVIDVIRLACALYVAAFAWRYWLANPNHGMTWGDILDAAGWPIRKVLNSKPLKGKIKFTFSVDSPAEGLHIRYDSNRTALKKVAAIIVGCILLALAIWLMYKAVWIGIALVWAVCGLLFTVWAIGAICQFWSTRAWKDGLTDKELVRVLGWPVFAYRKRLGQRQT